MISAKANAAARACQDVGVAPRGIELVPLKGLSSEAKGKALMLDFPSTPVLLARGKRSADEGRHGVRSRFGSRE